MTETGRTLREIRVGAGLSQARLASLAHTSQATIAAYETGAKEPSLATFRRLLGCLGVRMEIVPTGRPSPAEAARQLEDVLGFVDGFPYPPKREPLRFPVLARL